MIIATAAGASICTISFVATKLVTLGNCDVKCRLLDSMGMGPERGGLAPFDIFYHYSADDEVVGNGMEPFNPVAIACHEPISVS